MRFKCTKCTKMCTIDSLLVYNMKYYLQVHLDNSAYKIINNQMIDYLDDNLFEADKD